MSGELTFNGSNLNAKGFKLTYANTSPPAKKTITETLPYMSGSWDFTPLYGDPQYEERQLIYKAAAVGSGLTAMATLKETLENWLMPVHRSALIDDSFPNTYFWAECVEISESDDGYTSELEIAFDAYPFKISNTLYTSAYTPSAAADVVVTNAGIRTVTPTIVCVAAASIVYGVNTYALGIGTHVSTVFNLTPGANTFNVTSTGAVTISHRYEVL